GGRSGGRVGREVRGGRGEIESLLDDVRGGEQRRLVEEPAQELASERQPRPREARGERQPGNAREVRGDGEDVGQVHLQRLADLLAELEGRRGDGRHREQIALADRLLEVPADERPCL